MRRLGLEDLRPRARVVDRVGLAGRERALDEHVDRPAVLAVHHRQRVEVARGLEHAEEQVVGDHQHALVGEEDLEAGDALLDHRRHVGEGALVGLGDRDVEAVVDVRGAGRALLPLIERGLQPAALLLDHEVDDARRPAGRGCTRAGVVVVDRARAAERHRHVRVVVDQARQHEAAGRVDDLRVGVPDVADGDDLLPVDQDVGDRRVAGGHDRAAADERSHAAPPVIEARDDLPAIGLEGRLLALGHQVHVELVDADRLELGELLDRLLGRPEHAEAVADLVAHERAVLRARARVLVVVVAVSSGT